MQLTCPEFSHSYNEHKLEKFVTRFKEHISSFKFNCNNSKLGHNVLDNGHAIGPVDDIMEVLHITADPSGRAD